MKKFYLLLIVECFILKGFSQTSYLLNWGTSFSPAWAAADKTGTASNVNGSGVDIAVNLVSSEGTGSFVAPYPRVNGAGDLLVYNSTAANQVTMNFNSNTSSLTVTYTFSQPVSSIKMGIADIDKSNATSNNYFDSVSIYGSYGAVNVVPVVTKVNPSNWTLVSTNHAYANTTSGQGGDAASTALTTASQECSVLIDFGKKPVTTVTIIYTNATGAIADPDAQDIALGNISFVKTITVSGTVWNDVNGSAAGGFTGIQNGTETGTNAGGTLYANLVNTIGSTVAASVAVNADGTYSFSGVVQSTSLSIQLSTVQGVVGNTAPPSGLPVGWVGTSPSSQSFNTGTSGNNIPNKDFGIERPPETPDQFYDIAQPAYNSFQVLNGTGDPSDPGPLAASDPDDGNIGTGNTFNIVNVSGLNDNKLFYNGIEITGPQNIVNYDPALLQIQYTGASSTDLSFTFSTADAAGKSSNLATYSINWASILPLRNLSASALLQGSMVTVKWKTENEIETKRFYVERSLNNRNFQVVGEATAAGNFAGVKNYSIQNEISAVSGTEIIYYRIRLLDVSGKISYSNTVVVRLSKNTNVKLWPSPFSDIINLSLYSDVNTNAVINITDAGGKRMLSQKTLITKGANQVNISNLATLPAGVYFLQMKNEDKIIYTQKILKQ